jgi:hypothetical protein
VNIEGNFKVLLTDIDISDLKSAILEATQSDWGDNEMRQNMFAVAEDTKSIILKFNGPTQRSNHPSETTTFDVWEKWEEVLTPVIDRLMSLYPGSVISKCLFPSLKAGGLISPHYDSGPTLELIHRIHVPLVTNEDVIFTCGGEELNMKEGCAYELNNQRLHSVVNNGKEDRIHLLIDLYCDD